MISYFKTWFSDLGRQVDEALSSEQQIQFAASVLLVEAMMADHEVEEPELAQVVQSLRNIFSISDEMSQNLLDLATQKHETLVSLHEVTSIINRAKDQDLKKKIVYAMWCVALADKNKDKYEEHLIRRVADLLYLSHTDFIQARLLAENLYT